MKYPAKQFFIAGTSFRQIFDLDKERRGLVIEQVNPNHLGWLKKLQCRDPAHEQAMANRVLSELNRFDLAEPIPAEVFNTTPIEEIEWLVLVVKTNAAGDAIEKAALFRARYDLEKRETMTELAPESADKFCVLLTLSFREATEADGPSKLDRLTDEEKRRLDIPDGTKFGKRMISLPVDPWLKEISK